AVQEGRAVGRIVTEIGSALSGKRRQLLALLREATVTTIVVEHRDRLARLGAEEVAAPGRRLGVVDPSELALDPTPEQWQAIRRQGGGAPPPTGRSEPSRPISTPTGSGVPHEAGFVGTR
ncbi:MAG TPA: hypothetical protein VKY90_08665, partial [Candidatus Dormibacteraeota bacterium]|nr:hypothetical protein [Candidatus Dormibacteraeota bacterium]